MKDKRYVDYKVYGNNAVVTERPLERREKEREKELQRVKKNRRIRELQKTKEQRKGIIQVAAMILITGVITISGNGSLYSMQREISSINSEIKEAKSNNEALSFKLLKVSGLDNIKNVAENQLGMVAQDKTSVVRQDISKDNFQAINTKVENKNFIARIMDALF